MLKSLAGAAALTLSVGSAHAATFVVNSGVFYTGAASGTQVGTLTGTFTTNDALTSVTAFDLVASASGSFAGYRYTTANSSVTAQSLPQFFQIDSAGNVNELRIYFSAPLTAAGATISRAFSYESEPSGGIRFPAGTVSVQAAVPEPATWATMLLGLGLVAGSMRHHRRRTAVTSS